MWLHYSRFSSFRQVFYEGQVRPGPSFVCLVSVLYRQASSERLIISYWVEVTGKPFRMLRGRAIIITYGTQGTCSYTSWKRYRTFALVPMVYMAWKSQPLFTKMVIKRKEIYCLQFLTNFSQNGGRKYQKSKNEIYWMIFSTHYVQNWW